MGVQVSVDVWGGMWVGAHIAECAPLCEVRGVASAGGWHDAGIGRQV